MGWHQRGDFLRSNREAGFRQIYEANYDRVLAYSLRRAEPQDAQDAVAETWLVVWRRFDEVPDEPLPWLFGVCRKALSNKRRAQGRRAALHDRIAGGAPLHQRDHADAVGERSRIEAALHSLKEPDREALLLTAWEGLKPAEAAAALNCSARTFSVRLHRAKARLAKELALGEASENLPARVAVEEAP
jgi:RNA polymerase sigma factor (sigma-70 family)